MKKIYLFILLALASRGLTAQNISPVWENRFAGAGDNSDRYNKIIPDGSGHYYAVGYTVRNGNYKDFLTVKLDTNLDTMWTRTKNGSGGGDDEAIAVTLDASGNVYVTGIIDGGTTSDDVYTIKYDSFGNDLWDTAYNDPAVAFLDEAPVAIAFDPNNYIIVAGWTEQGTWAVNQNDYLVLKYDLNGNLMWNYTFDFSGFRDEVTAMVVNAAGEIFITGRSSNGTNDDWRTKKLTSAGATVWTAIYSGGNGDDRPAAIILDNTGNPIVTGRWETTGGDDDCRAIEYSTGLGTPQWSRPFGFGENDRPTCMVQDPATGDIYVGFQGDGNLTSITDYEIVIQKLNASGNPVWQRNWYGPALSDDIPAAITVDPFGNIIVCGKTDMNPAAGISDNDWITVKYDASGNQLYAKQLNGSRSVDDEALSLVTDAAGNAIVVGFVNNIATHKDATSVQYDAIGNPTYNKFYNGQGDFNESGRALVQDVAGNTYVVGYSMVETNNHDILIEKINISGGLVCSFLINGTNDDDDELESIAFDGTYVYACGTIRTDGQKSDFITMKVNTATCDTMWTRIFNDSLNQADKAVSLAVDASGNVYVTGESDRDANDTLTENDIVTIKYNPAGTVQWTNRYNGASNLRDEPVKLKMGNGGRVYVCGRSENTHDDDIILLAYDQATGAGISGFPAIFAGPFSDDDRATDFVEDASGNIFIAGLTQSSSGEDYTLLKYNSSGVLQPGFPKFFDGAAAQEDEATSLALDASGNVVITGRTDVDFDPLIKNYDYATLMYDAAGNFMCLSSLPFTYSGTATGDDIPVAVNVYGPKVFVTGQSEEGSVTAKNKNIMIRQYDWAGCGSSPEYAEYDGPAGGSEAPNATLPAFPAFYVTGSSDAANGQKDVITLKYDFSVGVGEVQHAESASLVYPNPFNTTAVLNIDNPVSGNLTVMINDVLGNEVRSYSGVNKSVVIEKGILADGMYSYRILDGSKIIGAGRFAIQ